LIQKGGACVYKATLNEVRQKANNLGVSFDAKEGVRRACYWTLFKKQSGS